MMNPQDAGMAGPAMPPGLMEALMGGAGAGGPAAGPPDAGGSPPGGGDETKPIDILKQMIEAAKSYIEVEPDEEDKATMTKVLMTLQGYLAKDQADMEKATGGSQRLLRKYG